MYVEYEKYSKKGYYVKENRRQEVISDRQRWYRYQEGKEGEIVHSQENQKV